MKVRVGHTWPLARRYETLRLEAEDEVPDAKPEDVPGIVQGLAEALHAAHAEYQATFEGLHQEGNDFRAANELPRPDAPEQRPSTDHPGAKGGEPPMAKDAIRITDRQLEAIQDLVARDYHKRGAAVVERVLKEAGTQRVEDLTKSEAQALIGRLNRHQEEEV